MRRIDKKLNMIKANLLVESRYLENKGLIKEDLSDLGVSGAKHKNAMLVAIAKYIIDKGLSNDEEQKLINKYVKDGVDEVELINQISNLKSRKKLDEMDYSREIVSNDFNFLNKPEFNGWNVTESGDEFLIKNEKFPFFEFAVFINKGFSGSGKEYPWAFEARSTGGSNYPETGHKGHYTIEKTATSDIESTFRHFLKYKNELILKTSRR